MAMATAPSIHLFSFFSASRFAFANLVTKQFIYDQSKIISTRIYSYNNNNLPIRVVTDFANSDDVIETYEYNNDGKPISGTMTTGGKLSVTMTFKQEKNKLIHTNISPESDVFINTYTFDDRNNLLKVEFLQNTGAASINEWSDYDDKKGVAASIGDAVFMLFSSPADNYDGPNSYGGGLGFSAYVGGRWFFADNIGVYAELGHGISTLNAGIAVKL